MSQKKKKPAVVSPLDALRRVRKELPPPARRQEDDKKYHRPVARRETRKEIERSTQEE